MPPARRNPFTLPILAAAFTAAVTLLASEILLRQAGYQPWEYSQRDLDEPIMVEPDPQLGWRNAPGSYTVPAHSPESSDTRVTILADGSRAAGATEDGAERPVLLFVGGSYTGGWAISDEDTFAWRIQARHPELRVVNLGTPAYGTYQSLLVMKRALSAPDRPDHVVYGLIEHHQDRNVADVDWLYILAKFSRRGFVGVPYCTLDGSRALACHAPAVYPQWPLREVLATVAFGEWVWSRAGSRQRADQMTRVTKLLLAEMNARCAQRGIRFSVMLLNISRPGRFSYARFTQRRGIEIVNCSYELTRKMKVPGEGHPNALMNERWAVCVERALELGASRAR